MRVAWSGGGVRAVRVPGAGGPVPRGRRVPRLPAPQVQGQDYLNIKYFKTNLSMLILTNRYSFLCFYIGIRTSEAMLLAYVTKQ